jgi:geranylgeranylglycerol-phosphate geranylgeranyltransferase
MNTLLPYLKISRLNNAIITGFAVALGFWLSRSTMSQTAFVLLVIAGIAAAAFGNVVNDIRDVATDRVSHANRPLPRNELSLGEARWYAASVAFTALISAVFISPACVAATLLPLIILMIYSRFLKGTPLAGNIVISLLVGYAILYGAFGAPSFTTLLVPAVLAFLLNLVREIIKDIQDEPGDRAAGIVTTASFSDTTLKVILYTSNAVYLILLFVPWALGHFGILYAGICGAVVLPIQIIWLVTFSKKNWREKLHLLSLLIKIEMTAGMFALAADRIFLL